MALRLVLLIVTVIAAIAAIGRIIPEKLAEEWIIKHAIATVSTLLLFDIRFNFHNRWACLLENFGDIVRPNDIRRIRDASA
ncbi:hypothetical protein D3C84_987930 [compost metagenome]